MTADPPAATGPVREAAYDPGLLAALGTRVLRGFLHNRVQVLDPPADVFGNLDPAESRLLVAAMVAAAQADGELTEVEWQRIGRAAERLGIADATVLLGEAAGTPASPFELLRTAARDARLASRVYAVSLLAVDRFSRVNAAYLGYAAVRLGLSRRAVAALHRQFGYETPFAARRR